MINLPTDPLHWLLLPAWLPSLQKLASYQEDSQTGGYICMYVFWNNDSLDWFKHINKIQSQSLCSHRSLVNRCEITWWNNSCVQTFLDFFNFSSFVFHVLARPGNKRRCSSTLIRGPQSKRTVHSSTLSPAFSPLLSIPITPTPILIPRKAIGTPWWTVRQKSQFAH